MHGNINGLIAAERREDAFREAERRRINRPDRAAPRAGWRERLRSALSDGTQAR